LCLSPSPVDRTAKGPAEEQKDAVVSDVDEHKENKHVTHKLGDLRNGLSLLRIGAEVLVARYRGLQRFVDGVENV
jgi:hypothetical protein